MATFIFNSQYCFKMKRIYKITTIALLSVTMIISSCKKEVDGCTDSSAMNYLSDATSDDGSCIFSHQIMVNTWNISAACDGSIMSSILPETIEILAGETVGDLQIDLGTAGVVDGSISSTGSIIIPSQEIIGLPLPIPGLSPTISGSGTLDSESQCTVTLTVDIGILGNETCILTLTL